LSALLGLGLFGCNPESKQCAPVDGFYQPLYTFVNGTCGATLEATNQVNFNSGRHGVQQNFDMMPNMWVTTDIVLRGCSVHMTQKIQVPEGPVKMQIDGQSIAISDEEKLTGLVDVTQYSPDGSIVCQGQYDGTFSKYIQTAPGSIPGFAGAGGQ
jgi:hypothetical protein